MWSPLDGAPMYRSTMSKERFAFLLRALRFDDRSTRQERVKEDRLAPIRPLWNEVVKKCQECYEPGPHLTVDEQLLAFRGRCAFRMYIPNKPAKYGLKIVMMCDVDSHYMCNAIPYLGKGTVELSKDKTLGEVLTTEVTGVVAG
ncbi:hypothetical protein Pcinc_032472 [Petrolisthes cinctipes]|uniref:PiggyBac transposable element-derived protein domain-containing protein n=1 Tax=Petrolisthes cinctipes TaxID=88211 RepID=A0AAE1EUH1_PETCI|nr:hypothetical protein Pcinc_032472 [Petrolisthes cinctipes]